MSAVAGCAALLALITTVALGVWRRTPSVTFGWLWYLATLAPVIGIVQVGGHAMADRSTYVPLVGLFVLIAWSGAAASRRARLPAAVLAGAAACVVLACGITARAQTWHWRNSIALWEHTIGVTPDSPRAHANLRVALARDGQIDRAIEQYETALRLRPSAEAHNNLALALARRGPNADAIGHALAAVRLKPDYVNARSNLAGPLAADGRKEEAVEHSSAVIQAQPDHALARVGLAISLHETGRGRDAIPHILEAIRLQPDDARWRHVAGLVFLGAGERAEATGHFEAALRLDPSHQAARRALQRIQEPRE